MSKSVAAVWIKRLFHYKKYSAGKQPLFGAADNHFFDTKERDGTVPLAYREGSAGFFLLEQHRDHRRRGWLKELPYAVYQVRENGCLASLIVWVDAGTLPAPSLWTGRMDSAPSGRLPLRELTERHDPDGVGDIMLEWTLYRPAGRTDGAPLRIEQLYLER